MILKMVAVRQLRFFKLWFFEQPLRSAGLACISTQNFIETGQTVAEIYFLYFWLVAVCHVDIYLSFFQNSSTIFDLSGNFKWTLTNTMWSLSLCKIWLQSLQSFWYFFVRLAWKCLFTPSLGVLGVKISENVKFLQYNPSKNAVIRSWYHTMQTAYKLVPSSRDIRKSSACGVWSPTPNFLSVSLWVLDFWHHEIWLSPWML